MLPCYIFAQVFNNTTTNWGLFGFAKRLGWAELKTPQS